MNREFDTAYESALECIKGLGICEAAKDILLDALEAARRDEDSTACAIICLNGTFQEFKEQTIKNEILFGEELLALQIEASKLRTEIATLKKDNDING